MRTAVQTAADPRQGRQVLVSPETHRRLKERAKSDGFILSRLANRLLDQGLDRMDREDKREESA
jgi:hypothetical protein